MLVGLEYIRRTEREGLCRMTQLASQRELELFKRVAEIIESARRRRGLRLEDRSHSKLPASSPIRFCPRQNRFFSTGHLHAQVGLAAVGARSGSGSQPCRRLHARQAPRGRPSSASTMRERRSLSLRAIPGGPANNSRRVPKVPRPRRSARRASRQVPLFPHSRRNSLKARPASPMRSVHSPGK
jgi:hypothetical protein